MILETGGISEMESLFEKGARKEYKNWGVFQNRKRKCKTVRGCDEGHYKERSQTNDWGRRES